MISLPNQRRKGHAKYKTSNAGTTKKTVIRMYKTNMVALAGIAYRTVRRNMKTNGNLAVK